DEPTNHLDLEMRHALTLALQDYQGALVVVSHERHLLKACCDDFLLVADGQAQPFNGDLDDYADWLRQWRLAQQPKPEPKTAAAKKPAAPATPAPKSGALSNDDKKLLRKNLEKAEKHLATLQTQQAALEATLADNSLYDSSRQSELARALAEKQALDVALASAEEAWLAASEAAEGAIL
ncbi:MAG: ABC transporter ATP-binding protein, partial [Moraxellaceae bacterium]|nr:ABC transporter ATP-binding protein [Moraxellaceae bacterium]